MDVDDLVVLAVVLNVTPAQLLMPEPPADGEEQTVQLTPDRATGWHRAWQWMCGDYWLTDDDRPDKDAEDQQESGQAQADWHYGARPHDPFGGYTFEPNLLFTREAEVAAVIAAVRSALTPAPKKNDLSRQWLHAAIDWFLTVDTGERVTRGEPDRG